MLWKLLIFARFKSCSPQMKSKNGDSVNKVTVNGSSEQQRGGQRRSKAATGETCSRKGVRTGRQQRIFAAKSREWQGDEWQRTTTTSEVEPCSWSVLRRWAVHVQSARTHPVSTITMQRGSGDWSGDLNLRSVPLSINDSRQVVSVIRESDNDNGK